MSVRLVLLLSAALLLAACNREGASPPAKVAGAACAACSGPINDERFAAQYRLSDGRVKSFDDPGCLFVALRQEYGEPNVIRFRDHDSDRWLSISEAWFARTPTTVSPHGYGWAAYASFAAAQDAVAKAGSGDILPYEQAAQRIALPDTPRP